MPTVNGLEIIISFHTASLLLIYGIEGNSKGSSRFKFGVPTQHSHIRSMKINIVVEPYEV